jgi:hypothetical protein
MIDDLETKLLAITLETDEEVATYTSKLDELQNGFHTFVRERRGKFVSGLRRLFGVKNNPAFVAEALHDYLWYGKSQRYNANIALTEVIDAQQNQDPNIRVGNCVGLTALYTVLALREGLDIRLMYQPAKKGRNAHVFPQVHIGDMTIDIEATRADGFANAKGKGAEEKSIDMLVVHTKIGLARKKEKERYEQLESPRIALGVICGVPEHVVEERHGTAMLIHGKQMQDKARKRLSTRRIDIPERVAAQMILKQNGRYRIGYTGKQRELYYDILFGVYEHFCVAVQKETELRNFLIPRNGYEALIQDCRSLRNWREKGIIPHEREEIQRAFLRNLSLVYVRQKQTNPWPIAYEATTQEVRSRIRDGRYAVTEKKRELIDAAIADLDEEDQKRICQYYALAGMPANKETEEEPLDAIQKLTYNRRMFFVMDNLTDAEIDAASKEHKEELYKLTPIDVLDGGRPRYFATDVLQESGIYCVEDLVTMREKEVLALAGIGKRRLKQLKERLTTHGYALQSE